MRRIPEVDIVRGWALVGMFLYHFVFNLVFLDVVDPQSVSWWWDPLGILVRYIFVVLVGVSLWLSYYAKEQSFETFFQHTFKRAVTIALAAVMVSVGTFIVLGNGFVDFGVLHLIAVSVLACSWLVLWPRLSLVLGVGITAIGLMFFPMVIDIQGLAWLGVVDPAYAAVDYFPVFPWMGVVMIGIWLGSMLYGTQPTPRFQKQVPGQQVWQWLGQHSLVLYLLHQLPLVGLAWLVSLILR